MGDLISAGLKGVINTVLIGLTGSATAVRAGLHTHKLCGWVLLLVLAAITNAYRPPRFISHSYGAWEVQTEGEFIV